MNKKLLDLLLGLINDLGLEIENKQYKDIFKLQKKEQDKILQEVADIILKYNHVEGMLDIPINERAKLKRKISATINKATETEYKNEKKVMEELLIINAAELYNINTFFNREVFKISYKIRKLPDKAIKDIINNKVKGKVWSDRLWTNKKTLNKDLRKAIYDVLDGKTDVNKVSREISKKYGQSFSKSRTLARTETTRVQVEVNEQWAKDNDIEYQMFTATLDNRTSKICGEFDGTIWEINDSGKPIPPLHPNCRSVLVNMPDKDWKPKQRLDNITKERINYKTYKEWNK